MNKQVKFARFFLFAIIVLGVMIGMVFGQVTGNGTTTSLTNLSGNVGAGINNLTSLAKLYVSGGPTYSEDGFALNRNSPFMVVGPGPAGYSNLLNWNSNDSLVFGSINKTFSLNTRDISRLKIDSVGNMIFGPTEVPFGKYTFVGDSTRPPQNTLFKIGGNATDLASINANPLWGVWCAPSFRINKTNTNSVYGMHISPRIEFPTPDTVTQVISLNVIPPSYDTLKGVVERSYGLWVANSDQGRRRDRNVSAYFGGLVGINATMPESKLQINIKNSDGSNDSLSAFSIFYDTLGSQGKQRLSMGINRPGNYSYLQSKGTLGFSNLALNPLGGNVGIGTNKPVNNLEISAPESNGANDSYNAFSIASSTGLKFQRLSMGVNESGTYSYIQSRGRLYDWEEEPPYTIGYTSLNLNPNGGTVHIGDPTPGLKLSVSGDISCSNISIPPDLSLLSNGANLIQLKYHPYDGNIYSDYYWINIGGSKLNRNVSISTNKDDGSPTGKTVPRIDIGNEYGIAFNDRAGDWQMSLDGLMSDHSSILRMRGNISADTVKVKAVLVNNWKIHAPDYVFHDDYKLRTLPEVEAFVKKEKHLPEVPSAEEMKKNGVDLSEMNMTLLKKVEELTIYAIKQQKEIDELKAKVGKQQ